MKFLGTNLFKDAHPAFAGTSPVLTYTAGQLTSIAYADGSSKTLTYTSGVLTRIVWRTGGGTVTKTLNYGAGVLQSITDVVS